MILATRLTFIVENSFKKGTFSQKWLDHLLPMTAYLVILKTDHASLNFTQNVCEG